MSPIDPPWLQNARKHIGLQEIPGKETAPAIRKWLIELKAWWTDDETPWCGVYVAHALSAANIKLPAAWYRAKAWLDWGITIHEPKFGCIVVFERKGGGHVGFVVGQDTAGRLMVLGGNQSNRVSVAPFDRARVAGYRWPVEGIAMTMAKLPVVASLGSSSQNEA